MIARDHQHKPIAAKRIGGEPPRIDGAGDDANIANALGDETHDLVRQTLLEVDTHIRMCGEERRQRLRQKLRQRICVREHAHLAGEAARVCTKVLAQPLGLPEDRSRVLQQRAARLRRRNATTATDQKPSAERLFHLANARARCSKREMRALRTMRDAARLDDMAKQAQIGKIETHVTSCFAKSGYAKCPLWAMKPKILFRR